MTLSPILLLRLGLPSKFSNPDFCHLINSIDLSFEIRILLFFEEHLLIIG
jgi:hypothetical protein